MSAIARPQSSSVRLLLHLYPALHLSVRPAFRVRRGLTVSMRWHDAACRVRGAPPPVRLPAFRPTFTTEGRRPHARMRISRAWAPFGVPGGGRVDSILAGSFFPTLSARRHFTV